MTNIKRYPFAAHATSTATRFLIQGRNGTLIPRGAGASFWFQPLGTTLSEVPVEDLEFGTIFPVTTNDRQELSVQAALTVRIVSPEAAARRLDFSINLASGEWVGRPIRVLQDRVSELARQFAARAAGQAQFEALLTDGLVILREAIAQGIEAETHLREAGIDVVGIRVIAVRPDDEIDRALQNKVREAIQAESDRATYERRAQAVDRERAIKENELNNRTELARREAELVELAGANERRRTEQELEREELRTRATVANKKLGVDARADEISRIAQAENQALSARLAEYNGADFSALIAAIAPELLAAMPKIESLTITPDMLGGALQNILGGAVGSGGAAAMLASAREQAAARAAGVTRAEGKTR